jgi:hypothetical protein
MSQTLHKVYILQNIVSYEYKEMNFNHRVFIAARELSQGDKFPITLLEGKEKHRNLSVGIFFYLMYKFYVV